MIVALDTDVLVYWTMQGTPRHAAVGKWIGRHLRTRGHALALTPQTLHELIHVCTDPRRFERPMSMAEALERSRALWDAREVVRVLPGPTVLHRTLELLGKFHLGRKRILDTVLAATLEAADVHHLATLNAADFAVFPFLEVVTPS